MAVQTLGWQYKHWDGCTKSLEGGGGGVFRGDKSLQQRHPRVKGYLFTELYLERKYGPEIVILLTAST